MTNNPTIDGVSRELLERIAEHCKFWKDHVYIEAIGDIEPELRALLDAGISASVKPTNELREHCKQCAEVVKTWPEWKRDCLGGAPAVERQELEFPAGAIHNGRAFIDQLESIYAFKEQQGHPLSLCSEWQELVRCFEWLANHATEAQSTITQLQARINGADDRGKLLLEAKNHWAERARVAEAKLAELESGRVEPVAAQVRFRPIRKDLIGYKPGVQFGPWQYTDLARVDMNNLLYIDSAGYETEKRVLYTAPPAPVSVMLPDFDTWYAKNVGVIGTEAHKRDRKIWNACLDATAALNGERK